MVGSVDWITQAVLGAAIGELLLGRRLGNRALTWGALLGILPDLLGTFTPYMDTARRMWWSQGITHSIWFIGLGSWAAAHLLAKLWSKDKILKTDAGWFVLAIWFGHVALDCITINGAALMWPFSIRRISFNLLNSPEPLFTAPLVVTTIWLAFVQEQKVKKSRSKKTPPLSKRRKLCIWGLGLAGGYALLALCLKTVAAIGFEADLTRRGTKHARLMATPMPYNPILWRGVVDRGDEFWIGYRTIFELHSTPVRWTIFGKGTENLATVSDMREVKTLTQATDGWWVARPHAKGAWLADIRFPENRVWGNKKTMVDSRFISSWVIDSKTEDDHLRRSLQNPPFGGEYFKRMMSRTIGNRPEWEANPRLGGVDGSLPEFLPIEE